MTLWELFFGGKYMFVYRLRIFCHKLIVSEEAEFSFTFGILSLYLLAHLLV